MAEFLCGGTIWSESEFQSLTATCGPNSLAMAESWATQRYVNTMDVYRRMRAAGRCDANGASNGSGLAAQAKADGFRVDVLAYQEPMPQATWRAFFQAHVGKAAVVFEPSVGQALKDYLTGLGEDAQNLKYHWATVFGWNSGGASARTSKTLPAGWWCADGDNYVNNTHSAAGWDRHLAGHTLCYYPDDVLIACKPVAAIAVSPKVAIPGTSTGGARVALPNGWKDDGQALHNPENGFVVVQAKRQYILNTSWDTDDVPLEDNRPEDDVEEFQHLGGGNAQTFRKSRLIWANSRKRVDRQWLGAEYFHVRASRDTLKAQNSELIALRDHLTAQLQDATEQIAQLQERLSGQSPAEAAPESGVAAAAILALAKALNIQPPPL